MTLNKEKNESRFKVIFATCEYNRNKDNSDKLIGAQFPSYDIKESSTKIKQLPCMGSCVDILYRHT